MTRKKFTRTGRKIQEMETDADLSKEDEASAFKSGARLQLIVEGNSQLARFISAADGGYEDFGGFVGDEEKTRKVEEVRVERI